MGKNMPFFIKQLIVSLRKKSEAKYRIKLKSLELSILGNLFIRLNLDVVTLFVLKASTVLDDEVSNEIKDISEDIKSVVFEIIEYEKEYNEKDKIVTENLICDTCKLYRDNDMNCDYCNVTINNLTENSTDDLLKFNGKEGYLTVSTPLYLVYRTKNHFNIEDSIEKLFEVMNEDMKRVNKE